MKAISPPVRRNRNWSFLSSAMMKGLHTPSHLRFEEIDGVILFLDLRKGVYHAMDSVAACMWNSIQSLEERAAVVQSLKKNFTVEPERLERDFDVFVEKLLKIGFLEPEKPEARIERRTSALEGSTRFLSLRAWLYLSASVYALSAKGFGATYARYSNIPLARPETRSDGNLLASALKAFSRAENFFYIKTAPKDCLPRSLALFRFLRRVGLPVEHCIGVKRFPFSAHAWVEYEGRIIYDNPAQLREFTTLARISA